MQRRGWRKVNGRGRRKGYRNPASSWYRRSKPRRFGLSRRGASQGFVKQQRTVKRSKLYSKASRGYSSSTGKTVQIVSKELAGTICQPATVNANAGQANRALYYNNKARGINIVNLSSNAHFVIPPDPTGVVDAGFCNITTQYAAPNNLSSPNLQNSNTPWYYFDTGNAQGYNDDNSDSICYQPSTLYILASPQSGQLWRLANYAQDYDKYRILAVKVHWVPICNTTARGIIVMYVETNPTVVPTIEKEKMMMNKNSITSSIYVPQTLTYVNPDKSWKWCVSPTNGSTYSHSNRFPDRLSDSFGVYIRYFEGENADPDQIANMGYVYIEYIAEFATQTNNNAVVGDPMTFPPITGTGSPI